MVPILTAEEVQARREYHKEWRRNNPDKVQAAQMRYWSKKMHQVEQEQRNQGSTAPGGSEARAADRSSASMEGCSNGQE